MLKRAARSFSGSMAPRSNALASRGTPNPDFAIVRTRSTSTAKPRRVKPKVEVIDFDAKLSQCMVAMLAAQAEVKLAKSEGRPYANLAATARKCRAEYLTLTGGVERRSIDVDQGSTVNPLIAV